MTAEKISTKKTRTAETAVIQVISRKTTKYFNSLFTDRCRCFQKVFGSCVCSDLNAAAFSLSLALLFLFPLPPTKQRNNDTVGGGRGPSQVTAVGGGRTQWYGLVAMWEREREKGDSLALQQQYLGGRARAIAAVVDREKRSEQDISLSLRKRVFGQRPILCLNLAPRRGLTVSPLDRGIKQQRWVSRFRVK